MRRRHFLGVLGGAAASVLPFAARAQQPEREGLRELGWTEGHNIHFDHRWPGDDPQRIRTHAAEIVNFAPDVILSAPAEVTLELNRATKKLPIVFANVPDPVAVGLVASISHPGGNMTGFANFEHALAGKWLEILKEMTPSATRVGVFYSRTNPAARGRVRVIEEAAPSLGVQPMAIGVSEAADIEPAFNSFAQEKIDALILLPSIFLANHRAAIIALATKHRFPAIYPFRYFVADGGLLSYGVDVTDQFRRAAGYVDRILKGANPADLPVQAPTKFELAINLKVAKALGLEVPPTLLALADEVIE